MGTEASKSSEQVRNSLKERSAEMDDFRALVEEQRIAEAFALERGLNCVVT